MRAPLRVPSRALRSGASRLEGEEARYVARVHRLGPGARLVLFDPARALEADAVIEAVGRDHVLVRVEAPRQSEGPTVRGVTLVQALGKGTKTDRVVQDATALGVARLVFVLSERVVARGSPSDAGRAERWQRVAVQTARQCGRSDVPSIEGPRPLHDVLTELGTRDDLGARAERNARASLAAASAPAEASPSLEPQPLRLHLDPEAPRALADALGAHPRSAPVCLLIGPEGGWSPQERAAAASAGFEPVRLGRWVLRTETAATAALGAVAALG